VAFTILVVDDEPALRDMICQMLELGGFASEEAIDGADALDKIDEDPPDAIILDVMMPHMDGITVCKTVRANPSTADLPIIMLSGKTQKEAIAEGLAAGANKYLCKPASWDELIGGLNELLAKPAVR
jgi:two-component system response regulator MprA